MKDQFPMGIGVNEINGLNDKVTRYHDFRIMKYWKIQEGYLRRYWINV